MKLNKIAKVKKINLLYNFTCNWKKRWIHVFLKKHWH